MILPFNTLETTFFFLNDPPTTEIYPLPLHDALPISSGRQRLAVRARRSRGRPAADALRATRVADPQPAVQAADQPGAQGLGAGQALQPARGGRRPDRKSTRLNSSH